MCVCVSLPIYMVVDSQGCRSQVVRGVSSIDGVPLAANEISLRLFFSGPQSRVHRARSRKNRGLSAGLTSFALPVAHTVPASPCDPSPRVMAPANFYSLATCSPGVCAFR